MRVKVRLASPRAAKELTAAVLAEYNDTSNHPVSRDEQLFPEFVRKTP
jgi:hypothetical protein